MDSWSYAAEGKTVSNSDMTVRCKDTLVDWDSKGCTLGNNMSVPSQQSVQNASFPVITGKQLSMGDGFCDKVGGGRTADQLMSISGALSGVVESNSRLSRSLMEGHANQESSLIDLKLGGFLDHRDVRSSSLFGGNPRSELSVPTKRARAGGASSQTAYCQVYGCSKDLSSSKDYHKRHKVCEVHSKTSRVVVNGIEQRFCQQCSRFHLLSEFDDGKRSCRKRLAGHNMRRRKPQVGIHSGGPARVLQSYNAGRFQGAAFSAASFVCQDLLPGGFLQSDKNGLNDLCGQYKFEDETNYFSLSAVPNTNEGLDSKSNFSYGYEKQFSSFNVSGASDSTGNDLQSSNSVSRSLFQETSLGNDEYIVFDTASAIQELPGIPASKIAPSLLSSQSQNFSQSSRNSLASSLVMLGNDQSSTSNYSEKLIGVGSRASFDGLSSKLSSSALSSKVSTDLGSLLIPDGNEVNFYIANDIDQNSEFMSLKQSLSCDEDTTINLLQLSSQLQRVEHQRQSIQVKQEDDTFRCQRSCDVVDIPPQSKG